MASHNVSAESPTWSGTPRVNTNQHIQDAIDLGDPGDTYVLLAGTHRGQEIVLAAGDTLELAAGAILNGGEDIGTSGWTDEGGGVYSKTIQAGDVQSSSSDQAEPGFDPESLEYVIIDGRIHAWVDTLGAVDSEFAYYDGTDIYIGVNPTSADLIEVSRATQISGGTGVTIQGADPSERGKICNYASDIVHYDPGITLGSGSLMQDVEVTCFSGCAIKPADQAEYYNVTVAYNGQTGFEAGLVKLTYIDDIVVGPGCYIHSNGWSGWWLGNEGGNSKFSNCDNLKIYGSLWDIGDLPSGAPDLPPAPLWLDINNDGFLIYGNVLKDTNERVGRGMFLEISYSGKVHDNICYGLGLNAEGYFWSNGIVLDGTGADTTNSAFSTLEIYENLIYLCSGGIACLQSGARTDWDEAYEPVLYRRSGWDYWITKNVNAHHNTTYFDGNSGLGDYVGSIDDLEATTEIHDIAFDHNMYLVEAADSRYNDDTDGGSGEALSWASWNSAGYDSNGEQIVTTSYDPDPFNGGAM